MLWFVDFHGVDNNFLFFLLLLLWLYDIDGIFFLCCCLWFFGFTLIKSISAENTKSKITAFQEHVLMSANWSNRHYVFLYCPLSIVKIDGQSTSFFILCSQNFTHTQKIPIHFDLSTKIKQTSTRRSVMFYGSFVHVFIFLLLLSRAVVASVWIWCMWFISFFQIFFSIFFYEWYGVGELFYDLLC